MNKSRWRTYIQLCLFPDWQQPWRLPTFTKKQAEADEQRSIAKRQHRFVQGWRAHECQLRLFSPDE